MNIKVVSLRRTKSPEIESLESSYLARLKKYATVEVISLKRDKIRPGIEQLSETDRKKIEAYMAHTPYTIVLTDDGKEFTSESFAAFINERLTQGISSLLFLVGGPEGLPADITRKAHARLSLSRLTLPHQLARLFLIEAIYRSFDILNNGPYHK